MITVEHPAKIRSLRTIQNLSYYPWIVWILASCFLFYKYLLQVSPSIMINEIMQKFELTAEGLGHVAAFYFYAYTVMQLPGGVLLDRYNLQRLMSGAILICTLGAYLFSIAPTVGVAKLGRIFIGFGGAFSAIGTMKLISIYFPAERFAYVSGLMMTLGMLGAVGGQAPLAYLSESLGWQYALSLCCFGGIILSLLMYFCLANNQQSQSASSSSFKELWHHIKHLLGSAQCWYLSLFSGLAFAPVSAFGGLWGVPFIALKANIDTPHAAFYTSLIFVGFAIGCPISGFLSDWMNRRKAVMCAGTSIGLLFLCAILYLPFYSQSYMAVMLFGFGFFSSFFFISFAMIREINPILIGGAAIGFINTFDSIFGALSEPGVGWLLDQSWQGQLLNGVRQFSVQQYEFALSILPMGIACALLISLFIKETLTRE